MSSAIRVSDADPEPVPEMQRTSSCGTWSEPDSRQCAMNAVNSEATADLQQLIAVVTASAIRSAIENIGFETATYVSRTATTPIADQSNARRTTIRDGGRCWSSGAPTPSWNLCTPTRGRWDGFRDIGRCREGSLPPAGPVPGVSRSGLVRRTRSGGIHHLRGYIADRRDDDAAGITSGLLRNRQTKPAGLAGQ